ncbi:hypothetical protein RQP46_010723 [Phenoliferia psychrophenolica]
MKALPVDEVYLRHILERYNQSMDAVTAALSHSPSAAAVDDPAGLADFTFFFQGHVSWNDMGKRRSELTTSSTGFLSFGPYRKSRCGLDVDTNTGDYPRMADIYEMFTGELCPKDESKQLAAWAAQFVVSKRRVLANEYKLYKALSDLIEAPEGHWIHKAVTVPSVGILTIAFLLSTLTITILSFTQILHDDWFTSRDSSDVAALAGWLLAAPLPHLVAFLSAQQKPQPNPTIFTLDLIPRNLAFLLLWTSIGSRAGDLRGAWRPFLLIYAIFTFLILDIHFSQYLLRSVSGVLPSSFSSQNITLPDSDAPVDVDTPLLGSLAKSRRTYLFALVPVALWYLQTATNLVSPLPRSPSPVCTYLSTHPAACDGQQLGSVDVVFSYFMEDINDARHAIEHILALNFISIRKPRVYLYNKGSRSPEELARALPVDEVIELPNVGREGATYLHHILSRYNSSVQAMTVALSQSPPLARVDDPDGLADHTFFFQEIYEMFTVELCPKNATMQLTTWAAQFVVSKRRILANEYKLYQALSDTIERDIGSTG